MRGVPSIIGVILQTVLLTYVKLGLSLSPHITLPYILVFLALGIVAVFLEIKIKPPLAIKRNKTTIKSKKVKISRNRMDISELIIVHSEDEIIGENSIPSSTRSISKSLWLFIMILIVMILLNIAANLGLGKLIR